MKVEKDTEKFDNWRDGDSDRVKNMNNQCNGTVKLQVTLCVLILWLLSSVVLSLCLFQLLHSLMLFCTSLIVSQASFFDFKPYLKLNTSLHLYYPTQFLFTPFSSWNYSMICAVQILPLEDLHVWNHAQGFFWCFFIFCKAWKNKPVTQPSGCSRVFVEAFCYSQHLPEISCCVNKGGGEVNWCTFLQVKYSFIRPASDLFSHFSIVFQHLFQDEQIDGSYPEVLPKSLHRL